MPRRNARSRTRTWLITAVAAGLALAAGTANAAPAGTASPLRGPVVRTTGGALRGARAGAVDEFLGIPYAAAPTGALRWHAPQPAAPWTGIKDATAYGDHCAQPASPFGVASTSEDCLNLNVFTPASGAGHLLPVMVWIHGGANVVGESGDYDPTPLVRDGVIVVTINYRLGALGFLADPALSGPSGASGDYGLMDQQAALRWVQNNIGRFGGDRRDVTLFGESSGGLSVLSQLASPQGKGLFSKAIIESGGYDLNTATLATAQSAGEQFAAKTGCADEPTTAQTASCLRNLPVSTILDDENPAGYQPDIDGHTLTQTLTSAFADGQFNRVPVINGSNHDERRLFVAEAALEGYPVTVADYQGMISAELGVSPQSAAVIAAQYPTSTYPNPSEALSAAWTDESFACPALSIDQSISRYAPTYAYEFNDENAPELYLPPTTFPYGAAHESELQYLFTLSNTAYPAALTTAQQQLAATMEQDWTTFARQGNPNSHSAESRWPRFNDSSQQIQSLTEPRLQTETTFAAHHDCAFWTQQSQ